MTLGENLQRIRVEKGFDTPAALARRIIAMHEMGLVSRDVSAKQIRRIEEGTPKSTGTSVLYVLAKALDVQIIDLLGTQSPEAEVPPVRLAAQAYVDEPTPENLDVLRRTLDVPLAREAPQGASLVLLTPPPKRRPPRRSRPSGKRKPTRLPRRGTGSDAPRKR